MNGTIDVTRRTAPAAMALLAAAGLGLLMSATGGQAIAIPIALAGGVIFFVNPFLGLLLLVGSIPLESALMLGGRSAPALLGMAVVGVWGLRKVIRRDSLLELAAPGLIRLLLLLLALGSLSIVWAAYPAGIERRLMLLAQLVLLAILVADLSSSPVRMAWVVKALVLAGIMAALLTLEQYYLGGVRRAGEGITGSINRTSITLVTIVPFAFFLLRSSEAAVWRAAGLLYIGLSTVAVAATFSRMNYLLLPVLILFHLLLMARTRAGRTRVFLLGAAAVVALSFVPMDAVRERADTIAPYLSRTVGPEAEEESFSGRGFHMMVGLAIFRDHPIVGAGYQNYNPLFLEYQWRMAGAGRMYNSPRSPHSSHIGFLANLGLLGFLIWCGVFFAGFVYVRRAWRSVDDPGSDWAFMVQAVGIALGLQFLYGFYGEIHQDKIFWLVIGLVLVLRTLGEARSTRDPAYATVAQRTVVS